MESDEIEAYVRFVIDTEPKPDEVQYLDYKIYLVMHFYRYSAPHIT